MLRCSKRELFVCLDERQHRVVVWSWIVAGNIALHAALCCRAPLCKLLDQLVAYQLVWGCRLHKLKE